MPSPFPGMDPYLEAPDLWPDFHLRLVSELSTSLNRLLPGDYYARAETRSEVEIIDEVDAAERRRSIVPDLVLLKRPKSVAGTSGLAVQETPRTAVSRWVEFAFVENEPARHHFVEVRDARRGHKIITVIEVLSPSNKKPGPERDAYAAKQAQVLESDASLIEIDLLRSGRRILPNAALEAAVAQIQPRPDYLVLLSRAWKRQGLARGYIAFPFGLRETLPCLPVPLREDEPEPMLDLQDVFQRTYEGGPYRRGAVDYDGPADPPLTGDDAAWAEGLPRA